MRISDWSSDVCSSDLWPLIDRTLQAALQNMVRMRLEEGAAMAADLSANCITIATELDQIDARAPLVSESYRARLVERLSKTLEIGTASCRERVCQYV